MSMFTQFSPRGAGRLLARVCSLGLFGCLAATQAGAASASYDPSSYASIVSGSTSVQAVPMAPMLVSAVRATRTPSKPAPAPTLSVSVGKIVYLKPHHRKPVMQFTIHLSRAYRKQVRVTYSTTPNFPGAAGEFTDVAGTAILRTGTQNIKVRVPITGPVNVANGEVVLSLGSPLNATIANGQGVGLLTPGVASGKKH